MPRAGIVTVAGKPNVGKSTLLNRIVGQKLSITSEKPQSTRDRIVGILTQGDAQMVVFDTPGLLDPAYELQETMRHASLRALEDADVILYLTDAGDSDAPSLVEAAALDAPPAAPVIHVVNKTDSASRPQLRAAMERWPEAVFVSALTGDGVKELLDTVRARLPESEFLYPADDMSTQSLRFFAAELVRETALEQLGDEVPYSVACVVEEFREDRSPIYVRALIYVERESQKKILIGSKGARIRSIGEAARKKIETLVGSRIYLDLWVKVLPNWRRDAAALERLGYKR
ncbi:MAG: GTPase Era [Gemmatimonadaceae bacterium]|nr:GTPase Era [Gemmatimonadaceae bacterium]